MKTITLLAALAALAGCAQQRDYSNLDPQTRAAAVAGAFSLIRQGNAQMMQNPFADMYRASLYNRPVNCSGSSIGGIHSFSCN
jgi:hypothetical protein